MSKILHKLDIGYALVGGLAVSTWVEPRATKDIDILVENFEAEVLLENLEKLGFQLKNIPMEIGIFHFQRISKICDTDDLITLDLMKCKNLDFNKAVILGATTVLIKNTMVKIATPEDLIILKSFSNRNVDRMDIENIKHLPNLNKDYIAKWIMTLNQA